MILVMNEYPPITAENAIERIRQNINESTQKLLKNLLEPSFLLRDFKQLYWNMVKILHLFYLNTDSFSSPAEMLEHVNAVIFKHVL